MRTARTPLITAGLLFTALAGLSAHSLIALPNSTSSLHVATMDEARAAPAPNFRMGRLVWEMAVFSRARELSPFRELFRVTCGQRTGSTAAECLVRHLALTVPFGRPSEEFVQPEFDPRRHLERHLAGEPGHCLTTAAIATSALLAVGIPARIVQVVSKNGMGHTLIGVWDSERGWVLVDSLTGGPVTNHGHPVPSWAFLDAPRLDLQVTGLRSALSPLREMARQELQVLYPEPWLYTRVGRRFAPWPFRGEFAVLERTSWQIGVGQTVFRVAMVSFALCAAVSWGLAAVPRSQKADTLPTSVRS